MISRRLPIWSDQSIRIARARRKCNTHWADGNAPGSSRTQIGGVLRRRWDAHQNQYRARVRLVRAPSADADRVADQVGEDGDVDSDVPPRRQAVAQGLQSALLRLLRG